MAERAAIERLEAGPAGPGSGRGGVLPPGAACHIAGVRVDDLDEAETLAAIERAVEAGGPRYMAVVNAAKLVAARRDAGLREILLGADIVTADGMSVVWASRLLERRLRERVTGIDVFEKLVARAARRGWSVYFLGASRESVSGTVAAFEARHPGLRVAGYRDGYFRTEEAGEVADAIRASGADLLFVAMGSPAQERWIAAYLERAGVRFAMGVGGSFDHVSGLQRRAPVWMQRAGLEWFYRLSREPRRLWKRYLIGNARFAWLVARQAAARRLRAPSSRRG